MSLIVGLTGGIGSGKSTVADLFAALGARIVDTDLIARELTTADGAALPAIVAAFGDGVLGSDAALDRDAMRRLVFSDAQAKARLEAILHPLIRSASLARARSAAASPYAILVVPLLVESAAYSAAVDRVLVVDCDEALQRARVVARNGLAPAEVQAIIDSQAKRAQRLAAADDVIGNAGDLDALGIEVAALHRRYLELSTRNGE